VASETYWKYLTKKKEIEGEQPVSAIESLAMVMVAHGEEFGDQSAYGTMMPLKLFQSLTCEHRTSPHEVRTSTLQACHPARTICREVSRDLPSVFRTISTGGEGVSRSSTQTKVPPVCDFGPRLDWSKSMTLTVLPMMRPLASLRSSSRKIKSGRLRRRNFELHRQDCRFDSPRARTHA
jgi:hypothetical protein